MARKNSRRRRPANSRTERKSILLILQGEVTEDQYFSRFKKEFRLGNITIIPQNESPEKMVQAAEQVIPRNNNAPFDHVYYVADIDDSTKAQLEQAVSRAKRSSSRETTHHFVFSFESFDTWLYAHAENLKNKHIPRGDLQEKLIAKGWLDGKHITTKFPLTDYETAIGNVDCHDFDTFNHDSCNTSIPSLIRALLSSQ